MSDSEGEQGARPPLKSVRTLKMVLVGDGTTGKTSLVQRTAQDEFKRDYNQTLGVDFTMKTVAIGERERENVEIKIWDIGGQTLGGRMLPQYLVGVDAVLFVYDITNAPSFTNLEQWVSVVMGILEQHEEEGTDRRKGPPHLALVANKSDEDYRKSVQRSDHLAFAKKHGTSGHFVSAKTGENVELTFKLIASRVLGISVNKREMDEACKPITAHIGGGAGFEAGEATASASSLAAASSSTGSSTRRATAKRSSVCSIQ